MEHAWAAHEGIANRVCLNCGAGEGGPLDIGSCPGNPADVDRQIMHAREEEKRTMAEEMLVEADREALIAEIAIQRDRADRAESQLEHEREVSAQMRSAADQERARADELQRTINEAREALGTGARRALVAQVRSGE
jgi:hypothetical protein